MNMHEPLLTRNDCQGTWQFLIFNAANTVLVHHNCHMQILGHGGDEVFEACARQLVEFEGYDTVHSFLVEMRSFFPTTAADALRRFEGIRF